MKLIKSYVNSEQLGELLLSCQATGRLWEGCSDGRPSPPQPASYPPPERAHKPPLSPLCDQPSLLELLWLLRPCQDLQFSPFIYTPSPWLHVTSVWCGRMLAADPRVGAVSAEQSLLCWGQGYGRVIQNVIGAAFYATIHMSSKKYVVSQVLWCIIYNNI